MKTLLLATAVALIGGAAGATVIDFNSSTGNISGVDLGGVTITAGTSDVTTDAFGPTPNGTTGIVSYDFTTGSFSDPFTATFDALVSAVSVDLGDYNSDADTLYLFAYDAANTLLDSYMTAIDASFIGMVTLSVAAAGIDHVVFYGVGLNDENNVYADNLTFDGVAPVPLPATGLLLLGGLGLLGGLRRSRKA